MQIVSTPKHKCACMAATVKEIFVQIVPTPKCKCVWMAATVNCIYGHKLGTHSTMFISKTTKTKYSITCFNSCYASEEITSSDIPKLDTCLHHM